MTTSRTFPLFPLPRLMRTVATALCLAGAGTAAAATVDVDYEQIKDQPFGQQLLTELKIDVPATDENPSDDPANGLQRLMLTWNGTKSPLVLQCKGVKANEMTASLADNPNVYKCPLGLAHPLPREKRYSVVAVSQDETVMGTVKGLNEFTLGQWPEKSGSAMTFIGTPTDVNLDELSDRIKTFTMTMSADGMLVAAVQAKDKKAAKALLAYVNNRLPLLTVAAAVGVEKAQFPKRMVDAAKIERKDTMIYVTVDLSKDLALRQEAHEFLLKTFRKRMKKST